MKDILQISSNMNEFYWKDFPLIFILPSYLKNQLAYDGMPVSRC